MNSSAILRQPAPLGTIPTWKVQIQAAKRAEAKRRQKLSELPDMKNVRDAELAEKQGIVKIFTKDDVSMTESEIGQIDSELAEEWGIAY
jgi:hypothetical protein